MTPAAVEIVARLEARGARLTPQGDAVAVTPKSTLADADREAIRRHKADVLAILRGRDLGAEWAHVSLWQLDKVLEVAVPWCDVRLLLAPGCRVASELRQADSKPGRVWCVCEILDLLLTNAPPEDARKVAEAKLLMAGAVAGARREA